MASTLVRDKRNPCDPRAACDTAGRYVHWETENPRRLLDSHSSGRMNPMHPGNECEQPVHSFAVEAPWNAQDDTGVSAALRLESLRLTS
jgi:hypothetical protein